MIDLGALWLSLEVATIGCALAVVVGTAIAGALSTGRVPGGDVVDALVSAPLVLPPTVLGYYALVLLGRESPVGAAWEWAFGAPLVFSRAGVVVATFLASLPFVVRAARAGFEEVDPRVIAAARTLGAPPLRVFLTITLPLARASVVAGATLGFARALGDFGVTLMLGGNIEGETRTASLAIYDAVQAGHGAQASGLAALLAAVALVTLTSTNRLLRRRRDGL